MSMKKSITIVVRTRDKQTNKFLKQFELKATEEVTCELIKSHKHPVFLGEPFLAEVVEPVEVERDHKIEAKVMEAAQEKLEDDFDELRQHREQVENEMKAKRWSALKKLGTFILSRISIRLGIDVPLSKD